MKNKSLLIPLIVLLNFKLHSQCPVVYTVSPVSVTICAGSSITMNVTSPFPGPFTYSWSPNTFLASAVNTLQSCISTPTTTPGTISTIIYSVTVSPTASNCPQTKTVAITIFNGAPHTIAPIPTLCSSSTPYTISVSPPGGTFASSLNCIGNSSGILNPMLAPIGVNSFTYAVPFFSCTTQSVGTFTVSGPNVTLSSSGNNLCPGQSATLNVSGADTYSWSNGGTGTQIIVTPLTSTVYVATGTETTIGCSKNASVNINILPLPTLTISGNTALCQGDATTLTASGASSYTWSGYSPGPSISFTPSASGQYTITGASSSSCTNTALANVTVAPMPTLTVNSNTNICIGQTFTLIAGGADTYSWSNGANGQQIIVTPLSNTLYIATGTQTASGCYKTASVNIVVAPLPTVTTSGILTLCEGNSAILIASGANSYTWTGFSPGALISFTPAVSTQYTVTGSNSFSCTSSALANVTVMPRPILTVNSGSICAGQTFTLQPNGAASYIYSGGTALVSPSVTTSFSVTGTSAAGCASGTAAVSTVSVFPLPVLSISASAYSVCTGQQAVLTSSGASSYSWSTNATVASISLTPINTTSYSVSGSSAEGCNSATSASVQITVKPLPNVSVSASSSLICTGQTVTLTAAGANSYSWDPSTSGAIIPVSPTITTFYTVTGKDLNGCEKTAVIVVTVDVCSEMEQQLEDDLKFIVFPNPTNGKLWIDFTDHPSGLRVEIYTMLGKLHYSSHVDKKVFLLDLKENAQGVYLLRILKDDQFILEKKIIKID